MTVNNNNTNSSVSEKTLHEVESAVDQAIQGYPDGALARLTKNCALNGEQTKVIKDILNTFKPDGVTIESQNLTNRILDELNHKGRCFFLINELPADILIKEIFTKCFLTDDPSSFKTLACTNKRFNQIVTQFVDGLDLNILFPCLRILNATMQNITVDDEPPVNKFFVLRCIKDLGSYVEQVKGQPALTLLTMCKDRTLEGLVAIAKAAGIQVDISDQILKELGDISVKQTYRVMITNNVFKESRNKPYAEQKELVCQIGCEMPTLQEYIVLCVFTNKIFNQCLYGETPLTCGRTSTQVGGHPLVVGGSAPALLGVDYGDCGFDGECVGAGGRRK